MKREDGFYWVKAGSPYWTIMYYWAFKNEWRSVSSVEPMDVTCFITQINETKLNPPE